MSAMMVEVDPSTRLMKVIGVVMVDHLDDIGFIDTVNSLGELVVVDQGNGEARLGQKVDPRNDAGNPAVVVLDHEAAGVVAVDLLLYVANEIQRVESGLSRLQIVPDRRSHGGADGLCNRRSRRVQRKLIHQPCYPECSHLADTHIVPVHYREKGEVVIQDNASRCGEGIIGSQQKELLLWDHDIG
jgi:hypothetical protein